MSACSLLTKLTKLLSADQVFFFCLLSADQALVQLGTQLTSQARLPVKIKPFLKYKEKGLRAFSQDGRRDQLEELSV